MSPDFPVTYTPRPFIILIFSAIKKYPKGKLSLVASDTFLPSLVLMKDTVSHWANIASERPIFGT